MRLKVWSLGLLVEKKCISIATWRSRIHPPTPLPGPWLVFTRRLTGNWSPYLTLPDPVRCHPFHRWGLWGPRPPSCGTEFRSGWANSKIPHSFHHCLPRAPWRGRYRNIYNCEIHNGSRNFSSTNIRGWMENCMGSKERASLCLHCPLPSLGKASWSFDSRLNRRMARRRQW